MNTTWTTQDEAVLLKLREKKVPYQEISTILDKEDFTLRKKYERLQKAKNNIWLKDEKVGVLDIECSNLKANYGFIMSWAIAYEDGTIAEDVVTPDDIFDFKFDKRITQSLVDELKKLDVVVTYYGKRFDIPFVRSRALFHKIDFPAPKAVRHIDLYDSVKHKMALGRNSLESATNFLGIKGKNHVYGGTWLKAQYGDEEALDYVLKHNEADVEITMELYKELKPVVTFTRSEL